MKHRIPRKLKKKQQSTYGIVIDKQPGSITLQFQKNKPSEKNITASLQQYAPNNGGMIIF